MCHEYTQRCPPKRAPRLVSQTKARHALKPSRSVSSQRETVALRERSARGFGLLWTL